MHFVMLVLASLCAGVIWRSMRARRRAGVSLGIGPFIFGFVVVVAIAWLYGLVHQ